MRWRRAISRFDTLRSRLPALLQEAERATVRVAAPEHAMFHVGAPAGAKAAVEARTHATTGRQKTRPARVRGAGSGCGAVAGTARIGQCDEAVAAPTPVWARTYWSSKASFSASAALLLSRVENSQVMKKAIGIENSAGWV